MDDELTAQHAAILRGLLLLSSPHAPTAAIDDTALAIARNAQHSAPLTEPPAEATHLSDPRPTNDLPRNLNRAKLTGAQLADADLTGANLTGAVIVTGRRPPPRFVAVRWSERTRWPSEFGAWIRERSTPLGRGLYQVQGSGSTGADLPVPSAPVR